jgi:hypothetical protein
MCSLQSGSKELRKASGHSMLGETCQFCKPSEPFLSPKFCTFHFDLEPNVKLFALSILLSRFCMHFKLS